VRLLCSELQFGVSDGDGERTTIIFFPSLFFGFVVVGSFDITDFFSEQINDVCFHCVKRLPGF